MSNYGIIAPARPVTPLACVSVAPVRPAAKRWRGAHSNWMNERPSIRWTLPTLSIVLSALMLGSWGCDAPVSANGVVRDSLGKPVGGATLLLATSGYERYWQTTSGSDGCFRLGGVTGSCKGWVLTVAKDGMRPLRADAECGGPTHAYDIALAPLSGVRLSEFKRVPQNDVACRWSKVPRGADSLYPQFTEPMNGAAAPGPPVEQTK